MSKETIAASTTWSPLLSQKDPDLLAYGCTRQSITALENGYEIPWKMIADWVGPDDHLVGLEIPEGLRPYASGLVERIRRLTGSEVILFGEPCFGACDVSLPRCEELGAIKIIHMGNACMRPIVSDNVLFVDLRWRCCVDKPVRQAAALLHERRICSVGLLASSQFAHHIERAAEILVDAGIRVVQAHGDDRLAYRGQVLGCNCGGIEEIARQVEGCVCLTFGSFHTRGLARIFTKPIMHVDLIDEKVEFLPDAESHRREFIRERMELVTKCLDFTRFGIIVARKPGQKRLSVALDIAARIRQAGKEAMLLAMDNVFPMYLQHDLEAYVSTACPRIALDNADSYSRPLLTPPEITMVLNRDLGDYHVDRLNYAENDWGVQ